MKILIKYNLLTGLFFLTFGLNCLMSQPVLFNLPPENRGNFHQIQNNFDDYWKNIPAENRRGMKLYQRWEHFWKGRVMPDGSFPDVTGIYKSLLDKEVEKKNDNIQGAKKWKLLGMLGNPTNIYGTESKGNGRISAIRFHPQKSREIWIGASTGGVWKSINLGQSWTLLPYTQYLSLGVSDIAFAHSKPEVVYVATGDADYAQCYSIGIIKTTDAGATWNITNLAYQLSNRKQIGKIIVSANNPDIVVATTTEGIYKTTDGGTTWAQKIGGAEFRDLESCPEENSILYATTVEYSASRIFRSSDFGDTWTEVRKVNSANRIVVSVTLANADYVYALCSASGNYFHSVLRSTDRGVNWVVMSDLSTAPNILGLEQGTGSDKYYGQGWYDLCLAVAPWDENEVYTGGINIWKSTDGGETWELNTHWTGGYDKPFVHADQHDLIFDEKSGYLFSGNDGGIDHTKDGGNTWQNLNKTLSLTQFYRLGCSATNPDLIYGGAQDNGTSRLNGTTWQRVGGGDGMECAVDWQNPQNAYISSQNGNLLYTGNGTVFGNMINPDVTRESGAWITPFVIDPVASNILYAGFVNVWKSTDNGRSWKKNSSLNNNTTLKFLAVSPANNNFIYAATNSTIWMTSNGGLNWQVLSGTPNGLSYLTAHPHNPYKISVTTDGFTSGYKVHEFDGSAWNNLSGNLPNIPVNSVVYQKNSPERMYIGTDIGVFMSDYGSSQWEHYGEELPNVIVSELEIQYNTGKLRAATYGRGIWETDISYCNLPEPEIIVTGNTSICQGDSLIIESKNEYPEYLWSNGARTKKITVRETGSYSLIISDTSGCTAKSKAVTVKVTAVPKLVIAVKGKFPPCAGDTINIDLTAQLGFIRYNWSTGDTTRRINITSPGIYFVNAVTKDSCRASASVTVEIKPAATQPVITRYNYNSLISSEAKTYQWYHNDNKINGAVNQVYRIDSIGLHTVEITDSNGCGRISEPYQVISTAEDAQIEQEVINIRPNPGTGIFTLEISPVLLNFRDTEVEITNVIGKSVSRFVIRGTSQSAFTIDITDEPQGVYYLTIKSSKQIFRQKIIKN